MFKNIYPLFEAKHILRKEMLENIRDYPRDIFQILYQDYSDGILVGCKLKVEDNYLVIYPGIIYYKQNPYILKEVYKVFYEATGKLQYLKVKFLEEITSVDKKEFLTQIYLDEIVPKKNCEIELGRFKLQKGARLRDNYIDFSDYNTEFDTLIKIYTPYASIGNSIVCPEILKEYAKTLMQYAIQNPWDYSFCFSCMQGSGMMSYDVVKTYLNMRQQKEDINYLPEEIYIQLNNILSELKRADKREENSEKERSNRRKVLL